MISIKIKNPKLIADAKIAKKIRDTIEKYYYDNTELKFNESMSISCTMTDGVLSIKIDIDKSNSNSYNKKISFDSYRNVITFDEYRDIKYSEYTIESAIDDALADLPKIIVEAEQNE